MRKGPSSPPPRPPVKRAEKKETMEERVLAMPESVKMDIEKAWKSIQSLKPMSFAKHWHKVEVTLGRIPEESIIKLDGDIVGGVTKLIIEIDADLGIPVVTMSFLAPGLTINDASTSSGVPE